MSRSKVRMGALVVALALFFTFVGAGIAFAAQLHMNTALTDLKSALSELQQSDADKGGHRNKAIDLVKQAIDETNAGIQAAK